MTLLVTFVLFLSLTPTMWIVQISQDNAKTEEIFVKKPKNSIKNEKINIEEIVKTILLWRQRQKLPALKCSPVYFTIGKKHALNKYDQFALNTSCFWGKYVLDQILSQLCNFTKF